LVISTVTAVYITLLTVVSIVARFFQGIEEYLIGFVDLLHACRGAANIRVVLAGKRIIGGLDHFRLSAGPYAEYVVVVFPVELVLFHG